MYKIINSIFNKMINNSWNKFSTNPNLKDLMELMDLIEIPKKKVNNTFIEKIPNFMIFTFIMSFNFFIFKK